MPDVRASGRVAAVAAAILVGLPLATCRDQKQVVEPGAPEAVPTVEPSFSLTTTAASAVLIGAGDIASCGTNNDEATAKLLDNISGTVFTLGDNAYSSGTEAEYANCYGPTWGRHRERTRPAAGDRDYTTAGAPHYFAYFGAAAGDPAKGYYSYDIADTDWHVIVLNTKLSMSSSSAQIAWLKADLAASSRQCQLAYWHKPRFYSNAISSTPKPAWDVLYNAGVDVVINADRKNYERFALQNPDGVADAAYGIRQFIVGTGGASSSSFGTPLANSQVRISGVPGVLKLTLDAASYSWQFVPIAGKTATDSGTTSCHPGPPPVARPGGPYASESQVSFNGSTSTDPQGDLPLTYEWNYGDGATGTGATPTHSYTAGGTYTVTLVVTDSRGNRSAPATTTAVITDLPPVVDAGLRNWSTTGQSVVVTGSFTDGNGGPWSYRITWGDNTPDATGSASEPGPIAATHTYAAAGNYTVTTTVTQSTGISGSDRTAVYVTSPGSSFTLLAAGDIAECGSNNHDEDTARQIDAELANDSAAIVFTLGDNAYQNADAKDFANCYHPTWGRHRDRTFASLGNADYRMGNANGAFDYFGTRAGVRGKGYYSVDFGNWHIIVVNDNRDYVSIASGSEQDKWLVADLAANTKPCILAIWHQPRFYSSSTTTTVRGSWKTLWERLYAAGADVILNGHVHIYERFAPMRPDGVRDDVRGIRQIIVGTGGEGAYGWSTRAPNSEVAYGSFGIIKLRLHANGYEWQFLPSPGETGSDSGSGTCH